MLSVTGTNLFFLVSKSISRVGLSMDIIPGYKPDHGL